MVECKICGQHFKLLKKHLEVQHNMSVKQYMKLFPNAKTVSKAYLKRKKAIAKRQQEKNYLKSFEKGNNR